MPTTNLNEPELLAFAKDFDYGYEHAAVRARLEFLQAYPLSSLKNLTLDEYVIGKGTASFCARVEAKTKAWASIQGATASKFGIYYGRTKSDSERKYRCTRKFGATKKKAFDAVKKALLSLMEAGKTKNFKEIDENPLSQMFKAKILSLYYPEVYLNVCSSEDIELIALELGLPDGRLVSEYQSLLLKEKLMRAATRSWSNPKFMHFLYAKFIRKDLGPSVKAKPRSEAEPRRASSSGATKDLDDRDDADVEFFRRPRSVTMRRLHHTMTNALCRICKGLGWVVEEGCTREGMFDALVREHDGDRHLLVEAKTDSEQPTCRLAVGQLLDYRRQLTDRARTDLAVLFPKKPSPSAKAFLDDVGVGLLWFNDGMTSVKGLGGAPIRVPTKRPRPRVKHELRV